MKELDNNDLSRRRVLQAIGVTGITATIPSLAAAQSNSTTIDQFVIEYTDLSAEAKAAFKTALASGEIKKPGATIPRDLLMHTHVLRQGQLYALSASVSYEANYKLESKQTSREEVQSQIKQQIGSAVDSPEELFRRKGRVQTESLDPRASQLVEKSLQKEAVTLDTTPPESLTRNQFLSHEGKLYRIQVAGRDRPTVTIAPTPVE